MKARKIQRKLEARQNGHKELMANAARKSKKIDPLKAYKAPGSRNSHAQ